MGIGSNGQLTLVVHLTFNKWLRLNSLEENKRGGGLYQGKIMCLRS